MTITSQELDFRAIDEAEAGEKWQALFREYWPAYKKWFMREGDAARPSLERSRRALRRHMPELVPTYERLVDLAGGGDRAARFLSLYRPAPFVFGCAQAVWTRGELALIRNYDYSPHLCDGVVLRSAWSGGAAVIALTDCLWGVLDGMNEHGLAVALAFGGRKVVGDGFSITIILRYVLETCSSLEAACDALRRIPSFMAYNVTVVDARGDFATALLSPDRPAVIERRPACTNHQGRAEWPEFEKTSQSVVREAHLAGLLADLLADPERDLDALVDEFLAPPLYRADHRQGLGTLYTALYHPRERRLDVIWPTHRWRLEMADFREQVYVAKYGASEPGAGAAVRRGAPR